MLRPKLWPLLLGGCVTVHVALALGYALVVPPLNWPDEPAHLNYSLALARGEGFAEMSPGVWQDDLLRPLIDTHFREVHDPLGDERLRAVRYQAHQPPLFYLLASTVLRFAPHLMAVRLVNLGLSCLSLIVAALFVRRALGRHDVALVAAGFLAVWPTRAFVAVSLGNDPLVELIFAVVFYVAASGPPRVLPGAALFGMGLLTKATALLVPAVLALWALGAPGALGGAPRGSCNRAVLRRLLAIGSLGLAVASPWLVRNVVLYGLFDPLALRAGAFGFAAPGALSTGATRPTLELFGEFGVLPFLSTLFASFWGVFGWMEMFPTAAQRSLYAGLSLLAVWGLALTLKRPAREFGPGERHAVRCCLVFLALLFATVVAYSLFDYQAQGRYLLPGAAPIALLVALGWLKGSGRFAPAVGATALLLLLGSNLVSLLQVIPWFLAS